VYTFSGSLRCTRNRLCIPLYGVKKNLNLRFSSPRRHSPHPSPTAPFERRNKVPRVMRDTQDKITYIISYVHPYIFTLSTAQGIERNARKVPNERDSPEREFQTGRMRSYYFFYSSLCGPVADSLIYRYIEQATRTSSDIRKKAITPISCLDASLELTFFCTFAEASLRACKAAHGVVDTPESKDELGSGRPPQQPLAAYRAND